MKAFCAVILFSFAVMCINAEDSGKYYPKKYNYGGRYMHVNDGRYVPMNDGAYNHVHDNRELGFYRHIPFPYIHVDNPYMGGYGPYYGMNYPYMHDSSAGASSFHELPTTTQRPHKSYDDEGKWRIIRQEEEKKQQKYDYFFETENGIFAQENGNVAKKQSGGVGGTSGMGWYQYIGDDDKIYRVEYEVGPQGFIPRGDHIHPAIYKSLIKRQDNN